MSDDAYQVRIRVERPCRACKQGSGATASTASLDTPAGALAPDASPKPCTGCGKPSTHDCDEDHQFRCGFPICDDCGCSPGYVHAPLPNATSVAGDDHG
jgi:hypothetical protein